MNLRVLSVTQAVERTGISRDSIYRLLESGELPGNRIGNRWRVSEAGLAAWINRTPPAVVVESSVFPEAGEDRFA